LGVFLLDLIPALSLPTGRQAKLGEGAMKNYGSEDFVHLKNYVII